MIRRLVDFLVALVALVGLAPLFALLAVLVVIDSPGAPFYGGVRVGKDGCRFRMWKFRTMVANADRIGPGITGMSDHRVTRVGAVLRRTKLDELPQFFNLLMGDLTLVGPRAEVPSIVARYSPEQLRTLDVKPGITGPGQIHYTTDLEAEIPDGEAPDEYYVRHLLAPKLRLDLDYLRRRTPISDVGMILKTLQVMFRALLPRGGR